ncbi:MAG TPA: hypothetical protein VGN61_09540 [Verrucomicrobiae bacterium]
MSAPILSAAIVGTNVPAQEINSTTIATLPKAKQRPWLKYLDRSNRQKQADKAVLHEELKRLGMSAPTLPPPDRSAPRSPQWKSIRPGARTSAESVRKNNLCSAYGVCLNISSHLEQ